MNFEIIDEDIGRETELMVAKMQPYDGSTVYGRENRDGGRFDFLGNEIKRYKKLHPTKRAFLVGSTIIRHYKCTEADRAAIARLHNGENENRNLPHYFITPGLEDEYRWALREEEYERKIGRFRDDERY